MTRRRPFSLSVLAFVLLSMASPAFGQGNPPVVATRPGVGESYWIEFSATWWKPGIDGLVSSDRLGLVGSQIDLVTDLAFKNSRHSDIRVVLRPARKHRFRLQYTPLEFSGESVLTRDITFAGQVYPVSVPVQSFLSWKVLRVGYEWDFFYRPRGFVGVLVEVRKTDFTAGIDSIVGGAEIFANAPLPALGVVGRAYPIRNLAVNFEVVALKLTDIVQDVSFDMMDLEFSATYNVTRNFGVSGGWRRMNTDVTFEEDRGVLNFKGLWFGGVVRY